MQNFRFDFKDSGIVPHELEKVTTPYIEPALDRIHAIVAEKQALNPAALVLVGIGGSNLGTLAVYDSVRPDGAQRVEGNERPVLISADTVDTDKLALQLAHVENLLRAQQTVLINVVTKSGKTTETIANFQLFLALLKRYHPHNYADYVVVTTDEGSEFAQFAQEQKFTVLTMPQHVGGRYSVFTAVGLFPLALLGVDIEALCAGARAMTDQTFPATSALIKYAHYQQGANIHDMFLFATDLFSFGLWYRQLLGESIGKDLKGITPTVSVGSTDLHSVGQLYLAGPRDKFTTFVTVERRKSNLVVPHMPEYEQFVAGIQGKPIATIMDAISDGTQQAYRANKRPFCTVTLPHIDAAVMGQLLQFYMIEMIYLGNLFEVNPFDQPNVELYKKETRKILRELQ